MRLRALRVAVDVGLITGALSLDQAADLIVARAPEPPGYAEAADVRAASWSEVITNFAETPLRSSTYQIGKTRITSLLADVHRATDDAFDLQQFHDYLWLNSQVPIDLIRGELLSRGESSKTTHNPAPCSG